MLIEAKDVTLAKTVTVKEALAALEASSTKILLLVDEDGKLAGTATDGDIRRAILKSVDMSAPVSEIYNPDPVTVTEGFNPGAVKSLMRDRNVRYIPVVTEGGKLLGLYNDKDQPKPEELDVPVVLMAGGLGRRLMPLTATCPKPLLTLGDKPILEHIIDRFKAQGFKRFYISVNYLGHMIEEHFGTGKHLGVEISYLREHKRLGTGGALSLLPNNMGYPFIVMNGDLITDLDFNALVGQHLSTGAAATMCVREYMVSIPFGVVKLHGSNYIDTEEKPTYTHHINAGIYCLSRDALETIPEDEFYDMPSVFEDLTKANKPCSVHVMRDRWLDVGHLSDYEKADKQFKDAAEKAKAEAKA